MLCSWSTQQPHTSLFLLFYAYFRLDLDKLRLGLPRRIRESVRMGCHRLEPPTQYPARIVSSMDKNHRRKINKFSKPNIQEMGLVLKMKDKYYISYIFRKYLVE